MFKKSQIIIDQALGALDLYGGYYGTSTNEFAQHRDVILTILRSKVKRLYDEEEIGAAKIVEGFISTIESGLGPNKLLSAE